MSNTVINAVIALVEDRPKDAREILRDPSLKISVSTVQTRLAKALNDRENRAKIQVLKRILGRTLRLDDESTSAELREFYLQGIADVERIIDDIISELES